MRDKVRKILWARSSNRCAICRNELVVNATNKDEESIIGEECHIVSGQEGGPHYDPTYPRDRLDGADNLILLCRVHHKIIDDQTETYSVDLLRYLKATHEKWIAQSLNDSIKPTPVRIRSTKDGKPNYLRRLMSGQEIMNIIGGTNSFNFNHDEPKSEQEAELIASFLQEVQDWGDIWNDLEAGGHVKISFRISCILKELANAEFWIFGSREIQILEGGGNLSSPWPVALLRIVRRTNPEIFNVESQSGTNDN